MSAIRVTVYGDKIDLADDLLKEFHKGAKVTVKQGAQLYLTEVQRLLRLRRGTKATAAPEGEPPEADTEALVKSFRLIPPRVKGRVAWSGVRSNHPGASRLEHGYTDKRGVRTLPHPYMRPASETVAPAIETLFTKQQGE